MPCIVLFEVSSLEMTGEYKLYHIIVILSRCDIFIFQRLTASFFIGFMVFKDAHVSRDFFFAIPLGWVSCLTPMTRGSNTRLIRPGSKGNILVVYPKKQGQERGCYSAESVGRCVFFV